MRMRRTLTQVLCVTLVINVSFLMFVVYSRFSRSAKRQLRRPKRYDSVEIPERYARHPRNNVDFVKIQDLHLDDSGFNNAGEDVMHGLRRDWNLSLKKVKKIHHMEPTQLFNVQKAAHGASCAEFLRKPVWFASPPVNPVVPNNQIPGDYWQRVNQANKNFYVFSAYYDVQGTTFWDTRKSIAPVIRIIGVTSERVLRKPLFCQMWFNQPDKLRVEQAILSGIPESHERNYSATYFLCPLWIPDVIPYAVSLVSEECSKPYNLIYVHQQPNVKIPAKDFTVCVTPLNMKYNKVNQLIQTIEFNHLFGADHLVFYNFSIGPDVDRILNHYAEEGLAEIVQWHLPLKVDTWPKAGEVEIHYFGQLAALNDCLYRNMYTSKYLVFTDLDELIVPRKHKYWSAMLDVLPETSVYHFRCAFFRRDWAETVENFTDIDTARKLKLEYLLTLDREKLIQPVHTRSKYIVEPTKVETVGIHNIWVLRALSQREHVVDPSIGLLHHYRNIDNKEENIHDPRILEFADEIMQRVRQRWEELQLAISQNVHISDKTAF